jgi:hypothetical protein
MKVRELISILEDLNPNSEICFRPENSSYVEDFSERFRGDVEISAFWGKDYEATVIMSGGQVGSI